MPQIRQPLEQQVYRVQRDAVAVREVQPLERLLALRTLFFCVLLRTLELDLRVRELLVHALQEVRGEQ